MKLIKCKQRRIICLVLLLVCLCLTCVTFVACSSNDNSDENTITTTEAVDIAKRSSAVQDEIAKEFGFQFYSHPSWGTVSVEEGTKGWVIELKGTISGYTDEYKSDLVSGKKFTAEIIMMSDGYIVSVDVTKEK